MTTIAEELQPNTHEVPIESNIVDAPGGSIIKRGSLRSNNFKTGISGWTIDGNGNVEFSNGVFRGTLIAGDIASVGGVGMEISGTNGDLIIYVDGVPRLTLEAGGISFQAPLGGNGGFITSEGGGNIGIFLGDGSDTAGAFGFNLLSPGVGEFIPGGNGEITIGQTGKKFKDINVAAINGATPLAGTKVYYVADSSGGAVTRKLTFTNGILTSET